MTIFHQRAHQVPAGETGGPRYQDGSIRDTPHRIEASVRILPPEYRPCTSSFDHWRGGCHSKNKRRLNARRSFRAPYSAAGPMVLRAHA